MKKLNMHTCLLGCAAAAMMFGSTALAAELVPGVTVTENPDSATGYTATFVYEGADAKSVDLVGTFAFYEENGKLATLPESYYTAAEWKPGMFRASRSDRPVREAMEKVEGTDYWTVSLDLPSGHYLYNYNIDEADEYITDPGNPPLTSTAESGHAYGLSTLNVPYADVQGASIDFSFMMPRENGQAGTLTYVDYTDVNGNTAPLAVYLPYGYDENRAEGYKTIYLTHGTGGSEMEWFAGGNTNYLMDNLIEDGKVEPTIVVTMSNEAYLSRNEKWEWDFELMSKNIAEYIVPFMEENYNVGTTAADRAFAGLSRGGMEASNMMYLYGDMFGYIGVWSACDVSNFFVRDREKISAPVLMLGGGCYDFGIGTTIANPTIGLCGVPFLQTALSELGIDYSMHIVKGGHDWTVWPQLLRIFATDYLWK